MDAGSWAVNGLTKDFYLPVTVHGGDSLH